MLSVASTTRLRASQGSSFTLSRYWKDNALMFLPVEGKEFELSREKITIISFHTHFSTSMNT